MTSSNPIGWNWWNIPVSSSTRWSGLCQVLGSGCQQSKRLHLQKCRRGSGSFGNEKKLSLTLKLTSLLRGHSNNTWHFFRHFSDLIHLPPPPVLHFSFFDHLFLGLICLELKNAVERKYLKKPNLAVKRNFALPKTLKTIIQNVN